MTAQCVACGRGVRPKRTLAADYPGLLCAGNRGECSACTTKRVRIAREERILMSANVGRPSPTSYVREQPVCGRRSCCHPGRQFGGDEACRVIKDVRPWVRDCKCHSPGYGQRARIADVN